MSKYRDDLGAAHRRIEILTAQIAERDAALAARELEVEELQAHLDLLEERPSTFRRPGLAHRLRGLRVPVLVGTAMTVVGLALSMSSAPPMPAASFNGLASAMLTDPMPAQITPALWEVEPLPGDVDPALWQVTQVEPSGEAAGPFDHDAATQALTGLAEAAASCRWHPEHPSGVAMVHVTFAESGRVSGVTFDGSAFERSAVAECIVSMFSGARVPPFVGGPLTIVSPVALE